MRGFYRMARGWMKNEVFKHERYTERDAWIWLIEEAAFRPRTKRIGPYVVQIDRGQIATSLRFLATAWGWDKNRVQRFLTRLSNDSMLNCSCRENGTPYTLITLCNYDIYQLPHETNGTEAGQRRDSDWTNEKEVKEGKEGKHIHPQKRADEISQAVVLWNALADECGLSKPRKITKDRQAKLCARLKDCGGIDGWKDALDRIRRNSFLRGENNNGWKVDFDFVLRESKFVKLIEGGFDRADEGPLEPLTSDEQKTLDEKLARDAAARGEAPNVVNLHAGKPGER